MANQQLDIVARSATTTPVAHVRERYKVAKLIDESKCIGCKACQVACMTWNDLRDTVGVNVGTYDNPVDLTAESWTVMRFYEVEPQENHLQWLIRKDGCMHCADPGCLKACPAPGAIVQHSNGIVDFVQDHCIGCGYCIIGCPFDIPRISDKDNKAYKCTLCSDRVNVGLEPACVKTCPTGAITFGAKDDMVAYGHARVRQLQERGHSQAGLYDPQGVGGTHVMYILRDASQPELQELPADPRVSPTVGFWKGLAKPIALAGVALAFLGGFFHYMKVGPMREPKGDQEDQRSHADEQKKE